MENKKTSNGKRNGIIGAFVGTATGLGLLWYLLGRNKSNTEKDEEQTIPDATNYSFKPDASVKKISKNVSKKTPAVLVEKAVPVSDNFAKTIAQKIDEAVYMMKHPPRIISEQANHRSKATQLMVSYFRNINTTIDYIKVNNYFVRIGVLRVNKTLLTQLFDTWGENSVMRKFLTDHFLKMGLKLNTDGKWSLNGFDENAATTFCSTKLLN